MAYKATSSGRAGIAAIYGCYYPGATGPCAGVSNIAPVGTATMGAGRWGQLDLSGNVWQRDLDCDWLNVGHVSPCTDCAYLGQSACFRVSQGSTFLSTSTTLSSSLGGSTRPLQRSGPGGIRCARSP